MLNKKRQVLLGAILLALSNLCLAALPENHIKTNLSGELLKNFSDVEDMVQVPDGPYYAVQSKNGSVLFISSTGRYVIGGVVFDIWSKKPLSNVKEMRYSFSHIDLKTLGVKPEELKVIYIGSGVKEVSFFVDPNCLWCHKLIEQTTNDASLKSEYKFAIYPVPALGPASFEKVKRLYCAKDTSSEILLDALMHDKTLSLPQEEKCDTSGLDKRLIVSEAIGVRSVPFIVGADGRYTTGMPKSLKNWLELGEKENEKQDQIYKEAIKEAASKIKRENAFAKKAPELKKSGEK